MELLIQLLPLILSAMNTVPQFQQAIRNGNPTVQAVENLAQLGTRLFPGIDQNLAAAAAASTMFDPVRVKWVQTALNVFGTVPPLDVDGEYGPLTTAAVQQFQKSKGLEVDGWAGDLTHAALQDAISKLKTPAA
jgi:peptidoglycan hydrolase-like protein with peptidoglycan-binding domain